MSSNKLSLIAVFFVAGTILVMTGCIRPASEDAAPWSLGFSPENGESIESQATATPFRPEIPEATKEYHGSPTPNPPLDLPPLRQEVETYVVQPGDTLMRIAQLYRVSIEQIVAFNELINPDYLEVGQVLEIPAPAPLDSGPSYKIIPNSELVNGPAVADFDVNAFVQDTKGYLKKHKEEVDGIEMKGADIVAQIAHNFSVNPRLLLALLEHQSGWLTNASPENKDYPLGVLDPNRDSLFRQLNWAADNLNQGYYLWRVNALPAYVLADGSLVPADPTINEGTAGIQYLFSRLYGLEEWTAAVTEEGLAATYEKLFGVPFQYSVDPLLPDPLTQPELQLPFENGVVWNFTGGPHGGWANGSAWAALDFAPPGDALGCILSETWVVAVADGVITHTGDGQVILDLDGDGNHHTGWTIFYMHIESRDRISPGSVVQAGDRIGHPSCEGGYSTGTHLHIARKFNGEWIPADQGDVPFEMDGWKSIGSGYVYDGWLERNGQIIIADDGRSEENEISR